MHRPCSRALSVWWRSGWLRNSRLGEPPRYHIGRLETEEDTTRLQRFEHARYSATAASWPDGTPVVDRLLQYAAAAAVEARDRDAAVEADPRPYCWPPQCNIPLLKVDCETFFSRGVEGTRAQYKK